MTRPRQKDSLDARIKEYVERRSREAARAQGTAVTRDDTVQHCSPCSSNPDRPSGVYFNWENEERIELDELELPSTGTGLDTPGQQCPSYGGIWEQGRTIADGSLTADVGSSQGGRISSPKERVGTRAGTAMTPASSSNTIFRKASRKPGDKTPNEENKQFDPGGQGEKARYEIWDAAVLYFLFGGELGSSLLFPVCTSCSELCVCCFPKLLFFSTGYHFSAKLKDGTRAWTWIESLMYATGGQAFSHLLPF